MDTGYKPGNFDVSVWELRAPRLIQTGPSLFTALREELGLTLDATKAPVDTIVIDSVEMPSEN